MQKNKNVTWSVRFFLAFKMEKDLLWHFHYQYVYIFQLL